MITQPPHQPEPIDFSQLLKQQLASSKFCNKIQSINTSLMQHIHHQIQQQNLVIPPHQKPFKLSPPLQYSAQKNNQNQLEISHLITKRQQIQNQLKKLQHQENKLHANQSRLALNQSRLSQSMLSSSPQRRFRSQLTEEEKEKIKSVIKAQRNFIKQLKQKQKQYYEDLEQDRKKKLEAEENIKKQKCQERKTYWQRIRNDIAQRQQSRKKNHVQEQERLQQVKKSKKLYEVLENSWNNQLAKDENLIKQATQHMRLNHKFDLAKIIKHQKEHQKMARQRQEARQKDLNDFQDKMKLTLPKIPSSKFFVTLKEEQRQKKQQQEEKQRKKYQLNQKKYEFAKKVKEQFKPKIDQNAKNTLWTTVQEEKMDKKEGLPLGQVQNLGNAYMKQVHKNVALVRATRGSNSKISSLQVVKKPAHKNYLNQLKEKRSEYGVKASLTTEVQKIMKNTSYSTIEKIERAKLVAKRLQGKENTKSSALISNINQKMKILRALNED